MQITTEDLIDVNNSLKTRGIRGALQSYRGRWVWRTLCSVDHGPRKQQRIPLGLPAQIQSMTLAIERLQTADSKHKEYGTLVRPLPWEIAALEQKTRITVADATAALRESFFRKKEENKSTLSSWKRLANEMNRLPASAEFTIKLAEEAILSIPKNSRARYEACKTYKRVAKLLDMGGVQAIDDLREKPTPKRQINPPTRQKAEEMLQTLRWAVSKKGGGMMWQGWLCCALLTYGCRPSEAFGLKPKGDGSSGLCWTIKRKNANLTLRTVMALHPEWIEQFELKDRPELPYNFYEKADYDPDKCKYYVNQTTRWLQSYFPEHTLYDLRHFWAVDAIVELSGNSVLAAKCMGHDHAVHTTTYHHWMQAADVERAVREIQARRSV